MFTPSSPGYRLIAPTVVIALASLGLLQGRGRGSALDRGR